MKANALEPVAFQKVKSRETNLGKPGMSQRQETFKTSTRRRGNNADGLDFTF